ncbi:hypothetical protein PUN28_013223 [Cardiocondyla obscurior]|uniref:Uncharacterized protein n=1 Tax=Cardiocondyla obscurior TaxID=286306 RepID=A0AAW2FBI8_9HYME
MPNLETLPARETRELRRAFIQNINYDSLTLSRESRLFMRYYYTTSFFILLMGKVGTNVLDAGPPFPSSPFSPNADSSGPYMHLAYICTRCQYYSKLKEEDPSSVRTIKLMWNLCEHGIPIVGD